MSARFPPDFVDRVLALPWGGIARRGASSPGERAGPQGPGAEFEEHRAYQPGDDPAEIDWQVFARTRKPHVKTQRRDRASRFVAIVDLSRSMEFGTPPKIDRALRAAAALALAAVARGARAEVLAIAGPDEARAEGLHRLASATPFLAALARWFARGDEHAAERGRRRALDLLKSALPRRPWILSDLYDLPRWAGFCEALALRGARPRLVQVFDAEELDPRCDEPVEWIDAETAERVAIEPDPGVRHAYEANLSSFLERVHALADRHGLPCLELRAGERELDDLVRFERLSS